MNWDQIEGEWKQVKGAVKSRWARFTDDDLETLGAKKDAIVGKIQERYGILREEAEKQVDEWIAKLSTKPRDAAPRNKPPEAPRAPNHRS